MENNKFCVIILAAGMSSRMKKDKTDVLVANKPLLLHHENAYKKNNFRPCIITLQKCNDLLQKTMIDHGFFYITMNNNPEKGQFYSVQCAIHKLFSIITTTELEYKSLNGIWITPIDSFPLQERSYLEMERIWAKKHYDLIIPKYNNKEGHPVLINIELAKKILFDKDSQNLRSSLEKNSSSHLVADIDDPFINTNFNTQEDIKYFEEKYHDAIDLY